MSTCRGTKADGSPCTYAAKENGFCGKHAVQAAAGHHNTTASMSSTGTCRGTKADGSPCSYVAKENGFCGKHAGQVVGGHRITTASTSICRGTKADGSPCTYAAKENGFCGKHADRALAGKKYIAAALPKRTTHKSCDVDDKVFAETVDPSLVAQGFAGLANKAIDVVESGFGVPYVSIMSRIRDLKGRSGNYMWLIKKPGKGKWLPVYLGKTEDLYERLSGYVNQDGSFGPATEFVKYAIMLNYQRRGFSIQIRYRFTVKDAKASETESLKCFNFALCDRENGGYRRVQLDGHNSISQFPCLQKLEYYTTSFKSMKHAATNIRGWKHSSSVDLDD